MARANEQVALTAIQDKKVRNIVRGILTAANQATSKKAMNSFRRQCSLRDARFAFQILQEGPLSRFLPKAVPFPSQLADVEKVPLYDSAPLEIELAAQAVRFNRDIERLEEAILCVGLLNRCVLDGDVAAASELITQFRARYGLSLMVATKAISIKHSELGGTRERFDLSEMIGPFLTPQRRVITAAFEDSVDRERDYLQVRRSYLGFVNKGRVAPADGSLIVDYFSPLKLEGPSPIERLQAFGRWGLLDTTAYLFRLEHILRHTGQVAEANLVRAAVPERISNVWAETFSGLDSQALQNVITDINPFSDRRFFLHLPAWSEYDAIYRYRLDVEDGIGSRLDGAFPIVRGGATKLVSPRNTINELLFEEPRSVIYTEMEPKHSGVFNRTIALLASIEAKTLVDIDGQSLLNLLDQTADVALLISRDEMNTFVPPKKEDLLYEFLRSALSNDLEKNGKNNHALRRAIQKLVKTHFNGNIVDLLDFVDSEYGHVSSYIYNLTTEAFLTELYDLYKETDEVSEAQASILEWYGDREQDEDAILRAKSHRLNLRLRKVRGAIEDTRIYVDPLRFIQWIQETYSGDLRALSDHVDEIINDPDRSTSLKDAVRVVVEPRLKLLKILDSCYNEFCTNKLYGVSSFIGRRIRHGTLHGHLVLELRPMIDKAISEYHLIAPAFAEYLGAWFTRFDAAVLQTAVDLINVRSKDKPRGLIIPSLDETDKQAVANAALGAVAVSMRGNFQLVQSIGIIQEYCWLLFEVDLKKTREAVEGLRRDFVIRLDENSSGRLDLERSISECIRSINTAVQQKFEIVRSWFSRPTNLSPSASVALLFEAVLDEVRQRYPEFNPSLDVRGADDVDLLGHRFHFFYDAMYILVDNAAKHGQGDGVLGVVVEVKSVDDKYTDFSISIKSDLASGDCEESRRKIEEAMAAEIGDAMVQVGKSGLRKLRGLVEGVEEIIGFEHQYHENAVIFTIKMRYIRT